MNGKIEISESIEDCGTIDSQRVIEGYGVIEKLLDHQDCKK